MILSFKIISFYEKSCSKTPEYLVQHIDTMLNLFTEDSKTIDYGEELLKILKQQSGFNIDITYVDLLKTSIIFHDIGKAFYPIDFDKEYASYQGHELLSTVIAYDLVERYIKTSEKYGFKVFYPMLFSTLFHHHAMDITRRFKGIDEIMKYVRKNRGQIINSLISDYGFIRNKCGCFASKLIEHMNNYLVNDFDNLTNTSYVKNVVEKIVFEEMKRILVGKNVVLKKLMYLTLSSLVCIDYEASRLTRCGDITVFGSACIDWRKFYLVSRF